MRPYKMLAAALLLAALPALAAEPYNIDPVHSSVAFAVRHLGISTVHGRFTDFSGSINYDSADPAKSSVTVTIKTASINTGNNSRDNDLRSHKFFDVSEYPEMTFQSTEVKKTADGWLASGTLTMKGTTKTVALPFTLSGPVKDPWGGRRIGAEAATKLRRSDYGVSADAGLIGDEVKITLSIEAAAATAK